MSNDQIRMTNGEHYSEVDMSKVFGRLLRRQKAQLFIAGMNGFLGRSSDLRRSVGTIQERSPVIYHGESSLCAMILMS